EFVFPDVNADEFPTDLVLGAGQDLDGFRSRERRDQTYGRVEDAGGVARFDRAAWRCRKDATQTSGIVRQDVHGNAIRRNCRGVDPRDLVLYRPVVEQVARLEIIGGV